VAILCCRILFWVITVVLVDQYNFFHNDIWHRIKVRVIAIHVSKQESPRCQKGCFQFFFYVEPFTVYLFLMIFFLIKNSLGNSLIEEKNRHKRE